MAVFGYGKEPLAGQLAGLLGEAALDPILKYVPLMDMYTRGYFAERLGRRYPKWTAAEVETFVDLLGDDGSWTLERALGALKKVTLPAEALPRLEGHFTKKSAVMRRELLGYLAGLPAEAALASPAPAELEVKRTLT